MITWWWRLLFFRTSRRRIRRSWASARTCWRQPSRTCARRSRSWRSSCSGHVTLSIVRCVRARHYVLTEKQVTQVHMCVVCSIVCFTPQQDSQLGRLKTSLDDAITAQRRAQEEREASQQHLHTLQQQLRVSARALATRKCMCTYLHQPHAWRQPKQTLCQIALLLAIWYIVLDYFCVISLYAIFLERHTENFMVFCLCSIHSQNRCIFRIIRSQRTLSNTFFSLYGLSCRWVIKARFSQWCKTVELVYYLLQYFCSCRLSNF